MSLVAHIVELQPVANQPQRNRIHTVAQTQRRRAVIENVSQVCFALSAPDCSAFGRIARIDRGLNIRCRARSSEARPACTGVEFVLRAEQRISTADAAIETGIVTIPVPIGEGEFGSLPARDREFRRTQFAAPLAVAPNETSDFDNALQLSAVCEQRQTDCRTIAGLRRIGKGPITWIQCRRCRAKDRHC
jgi:hypothetical protein